MSAVVLGDAVDDLIMLLPPESILVRVMSIQSAPVGVHQVLEAAELGLAR